MKKHLKQFGKTARQCAVALLLLFALVAVMPEDVSAYAAPKLNKTSAKLNISDTLQLKVSNTTKTVTYSTSKSSVATVSKKGLIKAKALGSATIYAKIKNSSTLKCKVTVSSPTYKISSGSKLYNGKKNTKGSYYLLRSYMKRLEKTKGGTLVLKAGTYKILKAVYIPSNVTLKCESGVKLVKDNGTGCSVSMFSFVAPSIGTKGTKENPVKVTAYNASSNVSVIGNDATINMNGDGIAFQLGHSQKISIKGFNMTNMSDDNHRFIDINSSKSVTINDCTMDAQITNEDSWNECINIDVDDASSFNTGWSSDDGTACDTITITDCSFKNAGSAVGTHYYGVTSDLKQIYHNNIKITNCVFDNIGTTNSTSSAVIRMMSWKDSEISDNNFVMCDGGKGCPIRADGCESVTVNDNTFLKCSSNTIKSTCNNKKYVCEDNFIYWTKYYNYSHPECTIYNTYTISGKTKNIVTTSAENYYEYYKYFVNGNRISSKTMEFDLQ